MTYGAAAAPVQAWFPGYPGPWMCVACTKDVQKNGVDTALPDATSGSVVDSRLKSLDTPATGVYNARPKRRSRGLTQRGLVITAKTEGEVTGRPRFVCVGLGDVGGNVSQGALLRPIAPEGEFLPASTEGVKTDCITGCRGRTIRSGVGRAAGSG